MERITQKDLEAVVNRINIITKSPTSSYTKNPDGKYTPNGGNFHLDGAYGGWKLVRMCKDGSTGVEDVFHSGYCSKRELYNLMHAFIRGYQN